MKRWILGTLLMITLLVAGSVDLFASEQNTQHSGNEGNVWTTMDGTDYFTCPVMKGEGKVGQHAGTSVIDNVTYYHCCPPCQGPFRKDPEKWLGELFLPANIERVDAQGLKHFVDPVNGMHGDVTEKTPVYDHNGQRWYFTSKRSMKRFKKNPEKYSSTIPTHHAEH